MIDYTKSAQLKEEGNKLYAQKSYAQAYVKYTCAIGEDANNAVLFANRAACSLAEKKCDMIHVDRLPSSNPDCFVGTGLLQMMRKRFPLTCVRSDIRILTRVCVGHHA